jgi:hypothetical protein
MESAKSAVVGHNARQLLCSTPTPKMGQKGGRENTKTTSTKRGITMMREGEEAIPAENV